MNALVSKEPSIPRSMDGGIVDPSHCILIDIVWTVVWVAAFHVVNLSASLISVTISITSVGVIGWGTNLQ